MDGGGDTVFTGQVRGMDALLARATVVLGILFGIITIVIAKMTS
ncbi:MAG: preprotein translocase subunit SecG, partial [Selenomonadaceae bacterium]|nr:preprotein translocase subunit SecG [Selenomonadaceae bacterium]